jgi:hypothetical protein
MSPKRRKPPPKRKLAFLATLQIGTITVGKAVESRPPSEPPNSVLLAELPFEAPAPGVIVRANINSLGGGSDLPTFSANDFDFGVGASPQGRPALWYKVAERDLEQHNVADWQFIWVKMNNYVQTIGLLTIGNLWIGNKLWSGDGSVVWERPQGVQMVPEKEYSIEDLSVADMLGGPQFVAALINFHWHVLNTFPRAMIYYETGCYLLRNSFPGHDFSADALLNFFKIGELVAAVMYQKNPKLYDIQAASRELKVECVTDADIANFYKVRGRDAAHDWLSAQHVNREDAVDCKNWSHVMLIHHWMKQGYDIVGLTPTNPRFPKRNP